LAALLNSAAAQEFYRAFVFWDAKRPITADLCVRPAKTVLDWRCVISARR
jgi:hypothetical protein